MYADSWNIIYFIHNKEVEELMLFYCVSCSNHFHILFCDALSSTCTSIVDTWIFLFNFIFRQRSYIQTIIYNQYQASYEVLNIYFYYKCCLIHWLLKLKLICIIDFFVFHLSSQLTNIISFVNWQFDCNIDSLHNIEFWIDNFQFIRQLITRLWYQFIAWHRIFNW